MSEFVYKGYIGSADVDAESKMLVGKLLFIRDVVDYKGETVEELETAFCEAVDDYLATCEELGKDPDVPCKGRPRVDAYLGRSH